MRASNKGNGHFGFVWKVPALLAALTLFGLLAALLGTGDWHWAAWLALLVPVFVGLWFSFRRKR